MRHQRQQQFMNQSFHHMATAMSVLAQQQQQQQQQQHMFGYASMPTVTSAMPTMALHAPTFSSASGLPLAPSTAATEAAAALCMPRWTLAPPSTVGSPPALAPEAAAAGRGRVAPLSPRSKSVMDVLDTLADAAAAAEAMPV